MSGAEGARTRAQRRTTLALFGIFLALLVLAAVINVTRRNAAQSAQMTQLAANAPRVTADSVPFLFPEVETTAITRIEFERPASGRKLILVKMPGDWRGINEQGAEVPVDLTKMPEILQNLATLRYNRVLDSSDVEAFGLSDGGRVIVRFIAGQSYQLRIGDMNPEQSLVYVQRGDEQAILLVPAASVSALSGMVEAP